MSSYYSNLSMPEIVTDLDETLSDLHINAGVDQMGPLLELLDSCEFADSQKPSDKLVAVMEELLAHSENQRAPRAQALFGEAVQEIKRLHDATA